MHLPPFAAATHDTSRRPARNRRLDVIDSGSDAKGGVERIFMILAKELMSRHEHVSAIIPRNDRNSVAVEWFLENGVSVQRSPELEAGNRGLLRGIWSVYKLLKKHKTSIVNFHSHSNYIAIREVVGARLSGVDRVIVSVHHAAPFHGFSDRMSSRIAAMFCDDIIVTTEFMKNQLNRDAGIARAKLHVVKLAVSVPETNPGREVIRRRLGLPQEAFVVSTLTRLVPYKGVSDLIRAIAQMPEGLEDVVLVVGGTGPIMDTLRKEADAQIPGRALFLGK